jgi:hypothetical protein
LDGSSELKGLREFVFAATSSGLTTVTVFFFLELEGKCWVVVFLFGCR